MGKQLTLDLGAFLGPPHPSTYIEKYLGLTEWKKTSEVHPPFVGWWRTWNEQGRVQRQWWNGHVWSIPMQAKGVGTDQEHRDIVTGGDSGFVVWCGLLGAHPAGYLEYNLIKSARISVWEKIHDAR